MRVREQEYKSKSQVKRELRALQELGRELVNIPQRLLDKVPLGNELREAIVDARQFKREARRRQIQYIGGLMRHVDTEVIRQSLIALRKPDQQAVQIFHEVAVWRDSLCNGDRQVMAELCERFPTFDRQHVRQLLRNAKKEQQQNKVPKSSRALFRYLNGLSGEKNT